MLTKNDLTDSILNECRIIVHLYGHIPEGGLDYRPTPGQRSTLELLQYLSYDLAASVEGMVKGNWDRYPDVAEAAKSMAAEDFPKAMEKQMIYVKALLDSVSDEEFMTREAEVPWGEKHKLGRALLELPYRCIVAYRMQLFLYAKAAGNDKINTVNNWVGVDWEPEDEKD